MINTTTSAIVEWLKDWECECPGICGLGSVFKGETGNPCSYPAAYVYPRNVKVENIGYSCEAKICGEIHICIEAYNPDSDEGMEERKDHYDKLLSLAECLAWDLADPDWVKKADGTGYVDRCVTKNSVKIDFGHRSGLAGKSDMVKVVISVCKNCTK